MRVAAVLADGLRCITLRFSDIRGIICQLGICILNGNALHVVGSIALIRYLQQILFQDIAARKDAAVPGLQIAADAFLLGIRVLADNRIGMRCRGVILAVAALTVVGVVEVCLIYLIGSCVVDVVVLGVEFRSFTCYQGDIGDALIANGVVSTLIVVVVIPIMGICPRIGLSKVIRQGDSGLREVDRLAILQAFCIACYASCIRRHRAGRLGIVLVVADNFLVGDIAILALGRDVEVQVMAVDGQGVRAILERVIVVVLGQQVVMVCARSLCRARLTCHGDMAPRIVTVPRLLRQVIGVDFLPLIVDIRREIARLLNRGVAADLIISSRIACIDTAQKISHSGIIEDTLAIAILEAIQIDVVGLICQARGFDCALSIGSDCCTIRIFRDRIVGSHRMAIFTLARDFDGQGNRVDGQRAGTDIDGFCSIRADRTCGIFDRCRRRLRRQNGSLAICSCLDLRLPDELIVVFECSVLRRIRQAELIVRRQSKRAQVVANHIAVFVDDYMRAAACDTADGCLICIRHVGCIIGHAAHCVECILVVADCGQGNHLIRTDTIR